MTHAFTKALSLPLPLSRRTSSRLSQEVINANSFNLYDSQPVKGDSYEPKRLGS